jgi:hypothetical protein
VLHRRTRCRKKGAREQGLAHEAFCHYPYPVFLRPDILRRRRGFEFAPAYDRGPGYNFRLEIDFDLAARAMSRQALALYWLFRGFVLFGRNG